MKRDETTLNIKLQIWYKDVDVINGAEELRSTWEYFKYTYGLKKQDDRIASENLHSFLEEMTRKGYFSDGIDYIPCSMIVKMQKEFI